MAYILTNKSIDNRTDNFHPDYIINKYITDDRLSELILVVPTGKMIREVKNSVIRKYYKKYNRACKELKIFNIERLSEILFNELNKEAPYTLISEAYMLTLFEEASKNIDLTYFSKTKKISLSVLEKLSQIIFGLKEDGNTPESILSDVEKDPSVIDINKHRDIGLLYREYQNLLTEGLFDKAELLIRLNQMLEKKINNLNFNSNDIPFEILNNAKKILIYGFTEFKKPEIDFLILLSKFNINSIIYLDYQKEHGPLFGNLEETINKLTNEGEFRGISIDNKVELSRTDYLRRNLFYYSDLMEIDNLNDYKDILRIYKAKDRKDEVKKIAKLVKSLIIEKGYEPKDICICMRQPANYTQLFREIFPENNIDTNISDRFHLQKSKLVISIFKAIDININEYELNDIKALLGSDYIKIYSDNGIRINSINISESQNEFRLKSGKRVGGYNYLIKTLSHIESKYKELSKRIVVDELDEKQYQESVSLCQKTKEDLKVLKNKISLPLKRYKPNEFNKKIRDTIIEGLGIKKTVISTFNRLLEESIKRSSLELERQIEEIEKDARSLSEFLKILDELTTVLTKVNPAREYSLSELTDKLKIAVTGAKYQIIERKGKGINITSIEQTRGIDYKIMILCGAVDGEFPISYNPEAFLGKKLNRESEIRQLHSERMQFYQFLTNNSQALDQGDKRIHIFFPGQKDVEFQVQSTFIDSLISKVNIFEDKTKLEEILFEGKDIIDLEKLENSFNENPGMENEYSEFLWIKNPTEYKELLYNYFRTYDKINTNTHEKTISDYEILDRLTLKYDLIFQRNNIEETTKRLSEHKKYFSDLIIDSSEFNKQEKLYLNSLKDKVFSVSQFENYAKCPYQYFINRVVRIDQKDEKDDDISAMEKGSMLHNIFYIFYSNLQKQLLKKEKTKIISERENPVIAPLHQYGHTSKKILYSDLKKIANDFIDKYYFDNINSELLKNDLLGTTEHTGIIESFFNFNENNPLKEIGYYPAAFEFEFGIGYGQDRIPAIEIDEKIKLKGKIDRIDILEIEDNIYALIIDYKTNYKTSYKSSIEKGESFQMPLYQLALQKIMDIYYDSQVSIDGCLYYSFIPKYEKNKIPRHIYPVLSNDKIVGILDFKKRNEDVNNELESSLSKANEIAGQISIGAFPVKPSDRDKVCTYCDFHDICRIRTNEIA